MSNRALAGVKPPPANEREWKRFVTNIKHTLDLSEEDERKLTEQVARQFPGGFRHRDEANAIVCIAVRNGPVENLHAGQSSPLLTDDTLSRLTDDEIKAIMIYASQMVAFLLWLRDTEPELYRRYAQSYAATYCRQWDREQ
jgi:hypothetical protein